MHKSASEALVARLITEVSALKPLYDENLADYDELLPHVLFGDITRFVMDGFAARRGRTREQAERILAVLEDAAGSENADVLNLISVSFLENLDSAADGYEQLRSSMGPRLREELARYE